MAAAFLNYYYIMIMTICSFPSHPTYHTHTGAHVHLVWGLSTTTRAGAGSPGLQRRQQLGAAAVCGACVPHATAGGC